MQSQFKQLNQALLRHQALWRTAPFQQSAQSEQPWYRHYFALSQWLADLTIEQIQAYKRSTPSLLADLKEIIPAIVSIHKHCILNQSNVESQALAQHLETGIPGKKLAQVNALGSYALAHQAGDEWLEWCAGKGYLGRILASHSGKRVQSLEWQANLCQKGQADANALQLPIKFIHGDALAPSAEQIVCQQQHVVGLHACGDLHVRLLQHASAAKSCAITISPCCYHLIEEDDYQPLSIQGKASELKLSRSELRIPVQETVTGGKRVAQHRFTEMSFRLGFDSMLREELKHVNYLSIPSIKKSQLAEGFEFFCLWAAQQKQLDLPEIDYQYWHQRGIARFWQMERLSLVQQLFFRPLELWLVLDRALFLQERGYRVTLAEFCPREITPRNILIHAQR